MITYLRDKLDGLRIRLKDEVRGIKQPRSPKWPGVRRAWLKLHPTCAACGGTSCLEVHHRQPFHLFPQLELDPTNFITLCEAQGIEHHFRVGHCPPGDTPDWKKFNPQVVPEAAAMLAQALRFPTP